uniref:Uncharacterized protein n=1 Tax=Timema monikensis TaxID=170555 RepID=A0A7R9E8Q9_9NEOP|nr:unnamed protein product [Timema monikensis]
MFYQGVETGGSLAKDFPKLTSSQKTTLWRKRVASKSNTTKVLQNRFCLPGPKRLKTEINCQSWPTHVCHGWFNRREELKSGIDSEAGCAHSDAGGNVQSGSELFNYEKNQQGNSARQQHEGTWRPWRRIHNLSCVDRMMDHPIQLAGNLDDVTLVLVAVVTKFENEWEQTSAHKVRSSSDMQFAFSYFYFLMSEKEKLAITDIFDTFDTDKSGYTRRDVSQRARLSITRKVVMARCVTISGSQCLHEHGRGRLRRIGTWSDREIRTILTQIYDLPLSYANIINFESEVFNCSLGLENDMSISAPPYERYEDSKLPVVTKYLISICQPITTKLLAKFGTRKKYKYEVIKEKHQDVVFKMLNSNLSQLIASLDEVRKTPKKFICLNDNLNPYKKKENTLPRAILQDFYESLLPSHSSFELPSAYRNRFLHITELNSWHAHRNIIKLLLYICVTVLVLFTIYNFLYLKSIRDESPDSLTHQRISGTLGPGILKFSGKAHHFPDSAMIAWSVLVHGAHLISYMEFLDCAHAYASKGCYASQWARRIFGEFVKTFAKGSCSMIRTFYLDDVPSVATRLLYCCHNEKVTISHIRSEVNGSYERKSLLTKQRNELDICLKGDLRLNLTNIEPDIQALTEIYQAQGSH